MTHRVESLVIELGNLLKQREWKLVTAESCTGGGLSYWITSVPGSSLWFERGFITYSNTAKEELLAVNPETLNQYGAVSEETACEMAKGALKKSQSQMSVAITGIAGPDGGTEKKPVGTVWISWASMHTAPTAIPYFFTGNRQEIREQTIESALKNLLVYAKSI